jgi:glycine dehydrogenase
VYSANAPNKFGKAGTKPCNNAVTKRALWFNSALFQPTLPAHKARLFYRQQQVLNSMSATRPTLSQLEQRDAFIGRHIGPDDKDASSMLDYLGYDSLEALIAATVPANILKTDALDLPDAKPEHEVLAELKAIASQNQVLRSHIGMGYYDTYTPPVILRNVLENPGWYTAYTPYQPEVAQGRLEGLLNFQQAVLDLTGMELANASLLDEATAAAEAMAMCKRVVKKNKSDTFFVANDCHPQTIAVIQTRAKHFGFEIIVGDARTELDKHEYFGAVLQYPNTYGDVQNVGAMIEQIHANNAMAVVATDLLSLALLTPPGELGADVVVGSAQRFGVPMGFGGPHAAFFATSDKHKRATPGRIIGVSVDSRGNTALRMALQTREQHIRREKANSNICTSQALLAIMAGLYAAYHGPDGIRRIATRVQRFTAILLAGLKARGFTAASENHFDTIAVNTADQTDAIMQRAVEAGINLRRISDSQIGISLDETTERSHIADLWQAFSGEAADVAQVEAIDADLADNSGIPAEQKRTSDYLQHEVFNSHHSETEMLRYIRQLEVKDIALNHSMIALGSCTMKLNATAEMIPVTWPEFGRMHPFAPLDQAKGYTQMLKQTEEMLQAATGYDAVSLQPNSGAQGEYAGLLAIKAYHESRGEGHRDVCLIPSSAHGTNPASAAMATMRIVIVGCDDNGNVNIDELREKAERHSEELAAIMITYPSTHGVFEEGITEICDIVHQHGGQVYIDGANMNALVGVAAPGKFGGDVSHLNLHKTFCIPHGGGGPGVGPIAVGEHLAPFMPNHNVQQIDDLNKDNDVVSAAPWGSAGIICIPWVYISLMGATGLKKATQTAILNANYMAKRLSDQYSVLYTGANGRVAHECIIDLRPLKDSSGITEEDIAKRLMDFGFHAPTMSFPVAGTLMIEPTESESKAELDRFCDAMLQIRKEIAAVEAGTQDAEDNALKNAPHSIADITSDWNRAYSIQEAIHPLPFVQANKYWPPVNRIDNVYGDRNLFCACPAIESYED